MKILIVGDVHLKQDNPINRKDYFYDSMLKKIDEINEIFSLHKCDYIVQLGDFFDKSNIRNFESIYFDVYERVKDWYFVAGNHDTKTKDLKGTSLGVLNYGKKFEVNDNKNFIKIVNYSDFEKESNIIKNGNNYINKVMFTHYYILPPDYKEQFDFIKAGSFSTDYNIYVLGHYHYSFNYKKKCKDSDGKLHKVLFYNPGSISRYTIDEKDYKRIPKVAILNLDDKSYNIEEIELKTAKKWQDVFDFTNKEKRDNVEKFDSDFVKKLQGYTLNNSNFLEKLREHCDDKEVYEYVVNKYNSK